MYAVHPCPCRIYRMIHWSCSNPFFRMNFFLSCLIWTKNFNRFIICPSNHELKNGFDENKCKSLSKVKLYWVCGFNLMVGHVQKKKVYSTTSLGHVAYLTAQCSKSWPLISVWSLFTDLIFSGIQTVFFFANEISIC